MNKKLIFLTSFTSICFLLTFAMGDGRGKVFYLKLKKLASQDMVLYDKTCYMISSDWLFLSKDGRSYTFLYLDKDSQTASIYFGKAVSQIPEERHSWFRLEENIQGKEIYSMKYGSNIIYFSDADNFEAVITSYDKGLFNYPPPLIKTKIDDCST